jgi:hypothetical protein
MVLFRFYAKEQFWKADDMNGALREGTQWKLSKYHEHVCVAE